MKNFPDSQIFSPRMSKEESLYPRVYECVARKRYGTEQLHIYLEMKKKALRHGNFSEAERLESGIARLSEGIAEAMRMFSSFLQEQSEEEFINALPEHLKESLASLLSENSRLEWLCLKELCEIKNFFLQMNAPCSKKTRAGLSLPRHMKSVPANI